MGRARATTAFVVLACLAQAGVSLARDEPRQAPRLPTEPSRWVGEPASWAALRGRVTLVFVWTFG